MGETSASIYPLAQAIMGAQFEKHFTEQRFYQPTFIAVQRAPKPVSAELYSQRNPYANPAGVEQLLADAASAGYIESDGKSGYVASEKGTHAIHTVHSVFYRHINQVDQFSGDKRKELADLLDKLVSACVQAGFPNGTLCLDISHNGHPAVEPASLAQIDQYLDDLNAFRDDAHIAAWTPVSVDGRTWEVLSFVWNGEANSVEKLVERLPYRTYLAEDYTATLNDITERGWIEPGEDGYQITAEGKRIRDEAEVATDDNFFAPWKILTDDEVTRLGELLTELKKITLKFAEENKTE